MIRNGIPPETEPALPSNPNAELALIGALILDEQANTDIVENLDPHLFHDEHHRTVAIIIRGLRRAGLAIHMTSVLEGLRETDPTINWADIIRAAIDAPGSMDQAPRYLEQLREAQRARQAILAAERLRSAWLRGACQSELVRIETERFQGWQDDPTGRPTIESLTTAQLRERGKRPDEIVSRLIVRGQSLAMGAAPKNLKTSIAIDIGVNASEGLSCLGGYFETTQTNVGIISGESGAFALGATVRRVAMSSGIDIDDHEDPRAALPNLIWSTSIPSLTDPKCVAAIRAFVKEHGLGLLFLDPLYLALGAAAGDASNVYAMGQVLLPIGEIGAELDCTMGLIHHTSKGASRSRGFDPPDLGDLSMSGVQEFMRQWCLLGRRSRYDGESGLHEIWLVGGGSCGHGGTWAVDVFEGVAGTDFENRCWDVTVRPAHEVRSEQSDDRSVQREHQAQEALERDVDSLVMELGNHPDGATGGKLRAELRWSGDRFNRVAAAAQKARRVASCKVIPEGKKTAVDGYQLGADNPT